MSHYQQRSLLVPILVIGLCNTACDLNKHTHIKHPQSQEEGYESKHNKIKIEDTRNILPANTGKKNGVTFYLSNKQALLLPKPIMGEIFTWLPLHDLLSCRVVCDGFNQILTDPTVLTTLAPRLKWQVTPTYMQVMIDKLENNQSENVPLSGFEKIFYRATNLPHSLLTIFSGVQALKFNAERQQSIRNTLEEAAKQPNRIKSLELCSQELGDRELEALITLSQPHTALQEIIFRQLNFKKLTSIKKIEEWMKNLSSKPNLQKLILQSFTIKPAHMQLLIGNLSKNSSLQELCLNNNRKYSMFGYGYDLPNLASILSIRTLRKLNLSKSDLTNNTTENFMKALIQNESLQELYLENNDLTTKHIKILTEALQQNKSLQVLDLSGNTINEEALNALEKALAYNNTLRVLLLSNVELRPEAIQLIMERLKQHTCLETLDISDNYFEEQNIQGLVEAWQANYNLRKVDLINNHLNWTTVLKIIIALHNAHISNRIERIDLGGNCQEETVKMLLQQENSLEEDKFLHLIEDGVLTGDDIAKYAPIASSFISKH